MIGRSLGGRSSRTSLTPRSTADDLIFKRQNTLPHPTGVITMDWESTGSLLPWSLLPWSLLPWSLLPWSLLPWSLLPGSLLPWSLLPWSLLPWSLLPWSQHSQPWFSESWASSIKPPGKPVQTGPSQEDSQRRRTIGSNTPGKTLQTACPLLTPSFAEKRFSRQ